MTSQSYIITFFRNDIEDTWRDVHQHLWNLNVFEYIGSQLERSPDTQRLHWQAFAKFKRDNKQRVSWWVNQLRGCHAERCSKERSQAINYGIKEDTRVDGPMETGTKPMPQVSKTNWEELKLAIMEGRTQDIGIEHVLRFRLEDRMDRIKEFYKPKDEKLDLPYFLPNPWGKVLISSKGAKRRHLWIYSKLPNFGKTFYFAKPLASKYKATIQNGDFQYWNVRPDDQAVILDEYNTAALKWSTVNSMCDGAYWFRRFHKGNVQLKDPLIIILSNSSILDLYPHSSVFLHARFIEYELV